MSVRFPEGFLWGTATSAHQVEGANYNSDWWEWEHDPTSPCTEPSGDACDHYHRYPDDLAILQDLGFNCYRFSIEWARIEPEEGEFSRAQLDHYRRVVAACRENGLLPIVTLHHFTSPRWVARAGGWAHPDAPDRFARYCQRAGAHLGDLIGVACTINEPNIVALMGYLTGIFPPGERDAEARERVTENFIAAHRMAVETLREHTDAPVGLTLAMSEYHAVDGADENMHRLREPMEDVFLDAVRDDDFIGVQTYSRTRVGGHPDHRHRKRDRNRRRRPKDRLRRRGPSRATPVHLRRYRRARLRLLVASRQLRMGTRIHADVRARRGRSFDPGARAQTKRRPAGRDRACQRAGGGPPLGAGRRHPRAKRH